MIFDELKLNKACAEQKALVDAKGFKRENTPTYLMLMVSELSEALEADRNNRHADIATFETNLPIVYTAKGCAPTLNMSDEDAKRIYKEQFEKHIKNTFEDEIADTFLRLMHLCGEYGIDIEKFIRLKAAYNTLRPIKHGKAY